MALPAFRAAVTSDYGREIEKVRMPALVIQSMADVAVPRAAAKWLAGAFAASLAMIPADGHFPHLVAPGAVNAALSHFLDYAPAVPRTSWSVSQRGPV